MADEKPKAMYSHRGDGLPTQYVDAPMADELVGVCTTEHDDAPWVILKRGLFYRPEAMGYTGIRDLAGHYSESSAKAYANLEGITCMKLADAPEFSAACFEDLKLQHIRDTSNAEITRLTEANAAQAREIEGLREAFKPLLEVCRRLDADEDLPWQIDGSMLDAISEALELKYPVIWTPEQVEMLKERQANSMMHPYTCGGDRSDAAHRHIADEDDEEAGLLYPTVRGWKCPACDYRQFWSHETGGPDAARALTGGPHEI